MLIRVLGLSYRVVGTTLSEYNNRSPLNHILSRNNWIDNIDARSIDSICNVISRVKPSVVINCIGLIKQKMTPESNIDAIQLNSLFPHQLSEICKMTNSRLIHFSTDCVFNGAPGIKFAKDTPTATDLYGLSKLLGEVQEGPALTLRTSVVGRQIFGAESLFEWAISQRGSSVRGYRHAIYTGLTTLELSNIVKRVIESQPYLVGLHQVASAPISKYDLLVALSKLLKLELHIEEDTDFQCDRTLDGTEFTSLTGIEVSSWESMLNQFAADQNYYENLLIE